MKPSDRLKEIEDKWDNDASTGDFNGAEINFLISLIKVLEDALESISVTNGSLDKTALMIHNNIIKCARKALEGTEK